MSLAVVVCLLHSALALNSIASYSNLWADADYIVACRFARAAEHDPAVGDYPRLARTMVYGPVSFSVLPSSIDPRLRELCTRPPPNPFSHPPA